MEEISKQIYVETSYDEVNVGAIVTPMGVICIDVPSYARDARDWAARMHRLSPYPVQNIILTDCNGDRILNTRWLNAPIIMQQSAADVLHNFEKKYPQDLIDSLTIRNPHRGRELSNGPVETSTWSYSGEVAIYRHGLKIVLKSAGGPTAGSGWVMLPDRKIIFAGDTLMLNRHPHLAGSHCKAWIESLHEIKGMVGINYILAGRGAPVTVEAIDASIAYLQDMLNVVQAHVDQERTEESLVTYVPQFFGRFPIATHPREWVQQQIRASLGYLYNEVQSKVLDDILE